MRPRAYSVCGAELKHGILFFSSCFRGIFLGGNVCRAKVEHGVYGTVLLYGVRWYCGELTCEVFFVAHLLVEHGSVAVIRAASSSPCEVRETLYGFVRDTD